MIGKLLNESFSPPVRQHSFHFTGQVRTQSPGRRQFHQPFVGHCAPEKVRKPRSQFKFIDRPFFVSGRFQQIQEIGLNQHHRQSLADRFLERRKLGPNLLIKRCETSDFHFGDLATKGSSQKPIEHLADVSRVLAIRARCFKQKSAMRLRWPLFIVVPVKFHRLNGQGRQMIFNREGQLVPFTFLSDRQRRSVVVDISDSNHQSRKLALSTHGKREIFQPPAKLESL